MHFGADHIPEYWSVQQKMETIRKTSKISEESQAIATRLKEECADRKRFPMHLLQKNGEFSQSTIYNWEAGVSSPKAEYLAHLHSLGIDVTYILTGIRTIPKASDIAPASYRALSGPAPAPTDDEDVFRVPVMATTASMGCGHDQLDADVVVREVPFSKKWLQRNAPHSRLEALRLIGSDGISMQGTINDGDLSLVDTDVRTTDVPGVYVLVVSGLMFIKRVAFKLDGSKVVSSDNPDDPLTEVLRGGEQLDVRGMVVYGWNGRRL